MTEKIAMVLAWHGPDIVVQKRTHEDPARYGFFGGKVKDGEEPLEAALREFHEEADIVLAKTEIKPPHIVEAGGDIGFVYQALLAYGTKITPREGVAEIWNLQEVSDRIHMMMPLTRKFVEEHLI